MCPLEIKSLDDKKKIFRKKVQNKPAHNTTQRNVPRAPAANFTDFTQSQKLFDMSQLL